MFIMIYKTTTLFGYPKNHAGHEDALIWFSGRRCWIRSTSKSVKVSYFDDVYSNTPGVKQGAN